MEVKTSRIETIVQQIAEAVLATATTVERLADRIDVLTMQVQHHSQQIQQQGSQVFALTDAVQNLTELQQESRQELIRLANSLEKIVAAIEAPEE